MYGMAHQGTPGEDGDGGLIDRGSSDTPSEQITVILRARITSGEYPPGSRVPSNNTLAQEFGVANRTVRKGMASLEAEGLIETKPGWGTFVASTLRRRAGLPAVFLRERKGTSKRVPGSPSPSTR